jgi:hypothetical protein
MQKGVAFPQKEGVAWCHAAAAAPRCPRDLPPRHGPRGPAHRDLPGGPDRADCMARFAALCGERQPGVYAWALVPNPGHPLVRMGNQPPFRSVRRLLMGDVVDVNRRHRRVGHRFPNRYTSPVSV